MTPRDDLISSTRFHRLIRRGRRHGAAISIDDALGANAPREKIGFHFICLNTNIVRQFEFVQTAWIANTKFGGLIQESDPLLGTRQPVPESRPPIRSRSHSPAEPPSDCPIARHASVRNGTGGAYFLLPSLPGLRYIANLKK